jgi:hypothetical protein
MKPLLSLLSLSIFLTACAQVREFLADTEKSCEVTSGATYFHSWSGSTGLTVRLKPEQAETVCKLFSSPAPAPLSSSDSNPNWSCSLKDSQTIATWWPKPEIGLSKKTSNPLIRALCVEKLKGSK